MKAEIGRVIYVPPDNPTEIRIQTLSNHVANVVQLAQIWDSANAQLRTNKASQHMVVMAAQIHDMGKPRKFRLTYSQNRSGKRSWGYSFAGHRFEARHDDPYTERLAQLHHSFSVKDIATALHDFPQQRDSFPLDLYMLEMCDQIEATIASSFLGSREPEARVFMDFQFRRRNETEFEIEPFVFNDENLPLRLTIQFIDIRFPTKLRQAVEDADIRSKRDKALQSIKMWLLQEVRSGPLQEEGCSLWPWTL